jgi:hypothetical protein
MQHMSENNGSGNESPVNRDHYFGACPECGGTDGYLNVQKSHWFVCDTHQTCWCAGSGLFSCWHEESEEVWAANVKKLDRYRQVEPLPFTADTEVLDCSDEIEPGNCMTGTSRGSGTRTKPDWEVGDDCEIPF